MGRKEWNALGQARRARGLGAGQSLMGRAQTFGAQSFALLVQAIRRGSRLAITMEARGLGALGFAVLLAAPLAGLLSCFFSAASSPPDCAS